MLGKLIGLVIAAVFVGALAPTAIGNLATVNVSGWSTAGSLWPIVPIVLVVAFVVLILKEGGVEF